MCCQQLLWDPVLKLRNGPCSGILHATPHKNDAFILIPSLQAHCAGCPPLTKRPVGRTGHQPERGARGQAAAVCQPCRPHARLSGEIWVGCAAINLWVGLTQGCVAVTTFTTSCGLDLTKQKLITSCAGLVCQVGPRAVQDPGGASRGA